MFQRKLKSNVSKLNLIICRSKPTADLRSYSVIPSEVCKLKSWESSMAAPLFSP